MSLYWPLEGSLKPKHVAYILHYVVSCVRLLGKRHIFVTDSATEMSQLKIQVAEFFSQSVVIL